MKENQILDDELKVFEHIKRKLNATPLETINQLQKRIIWELNANK